MAPALANTAGRQFGEICFDRTFPRECCRDIPSNPIRPPGLCWKDYLPPETSQCPACACTPSRDDLRDTEIVSIHAQTPGSLFVSESAASSTKAESGRSASAIAH